MTLHCKKSVVLCYPLTLLAESTIEILILFLFELVYEQYRFVWLLNMCITRMHSSRMRTARLLTVCLLVHTSGGCILQGWVHTSGGSNPEGCTARCTPSECSIDGQTNTSKNITFPQLHLRAVINWLIFYSWTLLNFQNITLKCHTTIVNCY